MRYIPLYETGREGVPGEDILLNEMFDKNAGMWYHINRKKQTVFHSVMSFFAVFYPDLPIIADNHERY